MHDIGFVNLWEDIKYTEKVNTRNQWLVNNKTQKQHR